MYGSYALVCVALLALRAGRTLLIGVVPAVGIWLMLSIAGGLVIQALGIDVFDGVTLRAVVFGLVAMVLGTALAVREIRQRAVIRLLGLLTALFVVSQVARWREFALPAAIMTGIAFNGLVTILIWWAFQGFLRLKSRGHLPDQVLHLVFCWLVLTAFVGLSAGIERQSLYLVAVPAVASTSTLVFLLRAVGARGGATTPKRMLLLRVFSQATARRRLLDVLDDSWRRVGGIDTVVGVDLALRTMNALALQDFLLGRLGRQMVTSTADLTGRLARVESRRAIDGRYPVNEFLCLPHVWQETVATLVHTADIVLMDLRGYTPHHRGATFELSLVVERVPVVRVVVLVDESSDIDALSAVMESTWSRLPANSPNHGVHDPTISVVRCSKVLADADAIVSRVFAAAYGRASAGPSPST
jgi:hypothetical protein